MITLRENQVEPIKKAIEFFRQKKKQVPSLMIFPTAWGKSILVAKTASELNENIIVIQPSKELLEQNYWKYINLCSDETTASVYSASFNSKQISQVTFCTIGSIKSKGLEFKSLGFKKVIIDEAHMYPREADGMLRTFLNNLKATHVLGVTATPFKLQTNTDINGNPFSKLVPLTSRSKKGNFFKEILHVSQIQEMVELGYWSPLEYITSDIDEIELEFNTSKAEYTEESVNRTFLLNNIEDKVYEALKNLKFQYKSNHILIFVPSVDIAIRMADKYGGKALFSGMPLKEREDIISKFKKGEIPYIFNVRILAVGFDDPKIDGIILGYSTASLNQYYQIIGRGTRINPEKERCVIYDLGGNYQRFGRVEDLRIVKLNDSWELISGKKLITSKPIHLLNSPPTFWFGEFKGVPLNKVPKKYIEWSLENVELDALTKKQIDLILNF